MLWSGETYEKLAILETIYDDVIISQLTFSPDEKMLSVIIAGKIHLYDTETYEEIEGLDGFNSFHVRDVDFSNTSEFVVWTKTDINISKIDLFQLIHTYTTSDPVWRVYDVSKNDKYILAKTLFSGIKHVVLLNAHWEPNAIKETEEISMLYPNPVNNTISCNINSNLMYQVRIYDINSNLMYSGEIISQEIFTHDVSEFTSGTYFLQLISNQNIETYKFIKE